MESEAYFETHKKPAADGFPKYIYQILTDDCFTLIDLLPTSEGIGWHLRVWKRSAVSLVRSGDEEGTFITTPFYANDCPTPLNDVTFKRGADVNTLICIQKQKTGLAGVRIITNEIVQTLANGKPATVTSKTFAGEGTGGDLLSQENLTYSESSHGTRPWDYNITRKVFTASVDAAGNIRTLDVTATSPDLTSKTFEKYEDFSIATNGGELGMKRLASKTEAYDVPGQTAQTTTHTYINDPADPTVHGRLQSTIKPDGSWQYNVYNKSSGVPITTEYSAWKDVPCGATDDARKTVTTVNGNDAIVDTYVEGQLVSKSKTTLTAAASGNLTTSEQWDGTHWHVTTTAYYPESANLVTDGRIKWIENSDGTAAKYDYANANDIPTMTVRSGAGNRDGISDGTEVFTTLGLGNIPIAQTTKDIASDLVTEQWVTDMSYNGGFDAIGRPVKRLFYYNGEITGYDITEYYCCGIKESTARDGSTISYSRDGLKRVYQVVTKASPASPAIATFTTVDGLTTTQTRRVGDSDSLFLRSDTRSLDGLTRTTTSPSQKSTAIADRPVTTSITDPATHTTTTTYADLSTSITSTYLDGQLKSVSGTAVADKTYDYDTHAENGGGLTATTTASGVSTTTYTDLLGRTAKTVSTASGTTTYAYHPLSAAPAPAASLLP